MNCGLAGAVVAAHHLLAAFLRNCCSRVRLNAGTPFSPARLFPQILSQNCCGLSGAVVAAHHLLADFQRGCCIRMRPGTGIPFSTARLFSVDSLAELVGAGCCGGGGSPPCCAWAAGTLFLLLFTRRLPRVCFFCRATVPAEHSARFVFVLVAGLTELIACFALALQNPP